MLPHDILPGLEALLHLTPGTQIVKDLLVIGHLAALAVGLGTVMLTDWRMMGRLRTQFTDRDFEQVRHAHKVIGLALAVLWATGLGLFVLKTGGDPSAASPKLLAKLVTVTWLSLTAVGMSEFGLALLERGVGRPLSELPLFVRLRLAIFAGMSIAGWSTALLLGAAGTTLTAEWAALSELLLVIHGGAVVGALLFAAIAGSVWRDVGHQAPPEADASDQPVIEQDVALPQAA